MTFLLLGCAGDAPGGPVGPLRDSLAATQASLRAIRGEAPPPPGVPGRSAERPALPVAAGEIPRPGLTGPGGPAPAAADELLRGSAVAVRARLGEPSLRRVEGHAEIWLYEAPLCRLDVILYREGDAELRVAHAEARAAGLSRQSEAECLRDIASRRPSPAA